MACTDGFESTCRRVGLPIPVVAPAEDAAAGTQPATMDAACTDGFESTFRRVGLRILVVAPAGDGVVSTNPAEMAPSAYTHMAPACTHSFETAFRVAGWCVARADNRLVGPIGYSATIVRPYADSFERTAQGIPEAPADVGVVGANPATLGADSPSRRRQPHQQRRRQRKNQPEAQPDPAQPNHKPG